MRVSKGVRRANTLSVVTNYFVCYLLLSRLTSGYKAAKKLMNETKPNKSNNPQISI